MLCREVAFDTFLGQLKREFNTTVPNMTLLGERLNLGSDEQRSILNAGRRHFGDGTVYFSLLDLD